MRIVFLIIRYKSGTAGMNRLLAYAKALGELGEDVHFYFLITNQDKQKVNKEYKGVTFHYVWEDYKYIKNKLFTLFYSLSKIKEFLKRGDCVLTYHAENILLFKLLQIRKRKRIRIYNEETEHPLIYSKLPFYKRMFLLFQKNLIKKLDGLFVISKNIQRYYQSQGICNVHVVNMIVDFDRFKGLKKLNEDKRIVYCGTVSKHKDGVDYLIKAFAVFQKKYKNYKLFIIGSIYDSLLLKEMTQLVEELNINGNVVFTGRVEADDMPQILKNAEMLVLARPDSLQAQGGFPTKLGEYLATSNPIVVTNVGEIGEFLQDGVNAYIANPGDVDDFADKMIAVADDSNKAKLIGERGRQTALECFSPQTEVGKILRVIQN